jgi:hypothetical protein
VWGERGWAAAEGAEAGKGEGEEVTLATVASLDRCIVSLAAAAHWGGPVASRLPFPLFAPVPYHLAPVHCRFRAFVLVEET